MDLNQFIAQVENFSGLPHAEKIKHFGWYLHTQGRRERFDIASIRQCYQTVHLSEPANLSMELARLAAKKPHQILKDAEGYRLERSIRDALDARYGAHETTITIARLLKDLPGKISNDAERLFLSEALRCYACEAFRATIIMTWNLAYDHLLNWLVADAGRLSSFNAHIAGRIGQKRAAGMVMTTREEFEDLKESEVLDICSTAGVLASHNLKKILDEQLTRRNLAAHPSLIEITRSQADDTITTLVNNIILRLSVGGLSGVSRARGMVH